MLERIARTDPFTQIGETIGSGPFMFRPDDYVSGSRAVYQRNTAYTPTSGAGRGLTAGPKISHFDRVEWVVIPEAATAAAALQRGEVEWFEQPLPELAASFRNDRALVVESMDSRPQPGVLRLNHLQSPSDNRRCGKRCCPRSINATS